MRVQVGVHVRVADTPEGEKANQKQKKTQSNKRTPSITTRGWSAIEDWHGWAGESCGGEQVFVKIRDATEHCAVAPLPRRARFPCAFAGWVTALREVPALRGERWVGHPPPHFPLSLSAPCSLLHVLSRRFRTL